MGNKVISRVYYFDKEIDIVTKSRLSYKLE